MALRMQTLLCTEITVLMAQSTTEIILATGQLRELPVSRGNAHLRQPVIRGNALLDGGQTQANMESQAQNFSRDWNRSWATLRLRHEPGCIRLQLGCSTHTQPRHQHILPTGTGNNPFLTNQFIGQTCQASFYIQDYGTLDFKTGEITTRLWILLPLQSTELTFLEYL